MLYQFLKTRVVLLARWRWIWLLTACLSSGSVSTIAGQLASPEASVHGLPELRDLSGRRLADGDFQQWLENEALHVRTHYDFGQGHWIQEDGVFQQKPEVIQQSWSWKEAQSSNTLRYFTVDFKSGEARAEVSSGGQTKRWSERVKIQPGRTFSGIGFTLAIKSVREQLLRGEKAEFQAIGFSPKPRQVRVEISYAGLNIVPMSDREPVGECFVIHPKLPFIAKAFVSVPDTKIWLTHSPPPEFLRWEGSLVEPDDPVVRVDLVSGGPSRPAEPFPATPH
jgi:hypothetical protein